MADNRKLQLEAEVSDNTRAGFESIKAGAADMAQGVAQSSQAAGKAVDGIANGAGVGAQKFDGATRSIIGSIQRATAVMEAGERGSAKYFEALAGQRGANLDALKPYLEQLRQAETAQQAATSSLAKMGVSAGQTAAALRQVPAQFTDIITSLQGGQQPLTVFLQQGGQLKDMFGGAGAAARALGGYVLGLVNPFTVAAAGAAALAVAYNQGSKEADAYRIALVTTGNAAGTTVGQLNDQAKAIAGVIGTQGKAAESLAALASTGKVGADILKQAGLAAVAYERATGTAISKTAEKFASLAESPLQAVLKLNEGTNYLTESVYRQIKSLEEQGKVADAAALAQRTYADALTSRASQIESNLGSIEKAWLRVKDAAKSGWDAMLSIGRQESSADQLTATRARIAELENRLASGSGFGGTGGGAATGRPDGRARARIEAELSALQAKAAALAGVAYAATEAAAADAKRAAQMEALTKWDKEGAKFLKDNIKLERELEQARKQGAAAGKTQQEIETRLGEIRASYAKKSGGSKSEGNPFAAEQEAAKAWAKTMEQATKGIADAEAKTLDLNKAQAALVEYLSSPAYATNSEEMRQSALAKLYAWDAAIKHADGIKAEAAAMEAANKSMSAWYDSRAKETERLSEQIQARREEVAAMGLSAEAAAQLAAAKNEQAAAEKEAYAVALEAASFYAGEYAEAYKVAAAAAREQAAQLRELAGIDLEKGAKQTAINVAEEWKRTADQIGNSLTDALMRGFESGKDFARNLRDVVVNMFKTMVLRPIISAIVNPIAGAVSSAVNSAIGSSVLGQIGGSALGGAALGAGAIGWGTTGLANITGFLGGDALGVMAAGASGGFGSALGAAIAQVPVWGWIAAGLAAIATAIDDSGTYHTGGSAMYENGRVVTSSTEGYGTGMGAVENSDAVRTAVGNIARGIGGSLNLLAKKVGPGGEYSVATSFADDTSKDGAWGALRIARNGEDIVNWNNNRQSKWAPREFADGDAGMKEYLKAVAADVSKAIDDMGLPEWAMRIKKENPTETLEDLTKVIEQIAAYPEQLLNRYGTSSEQLMAAWMDGIQTGDAEQAGRSVADLLVDSIEQSMYQTGMQQIFDIMNTGIITPMLDALVTGAAVSEAVSQATIEATIEKASKAAEALATLFNDPAFVEAMQRIRGVVADAFGRVGGAVPGRPTPSYQSDSQRRAEQERLIRAAFEAQGAILKAQMSALETEQQGYRTQIQGIQRQQDAWRAEQAAIQETLTTLQSVADDLRGVIDTLEGGIRQLTDSVDSTAKQNAAQAQAYLLTLLETVRGGGVFPGADEVGRNLEAAISGVNESVYQSLAQEQAAKLGLAAILRDLKKEGIEQLDPVEQQIKLAEEQLDALEEMIKAADEQIDGLQDLIDANQAQIGVLQQQYQALQDQLDAALTTNDGIGLLNSTMMLVRNAIMDQTPSEDLILGNNGAVYNKQTGVGINAHAELFSGLNLRQVFEGHVGAGLPFSDVYDLMKGSGFTLAQLDAILGYPADYLEAFAREAGLPIFHRGTNYVPQTGLALLEKGEAVIPKAYNSVQGPGYTPPLNGTSANSESMDKLIAEVRGLRAQVAETNRHAANTSKAVNGSPDAPMLVETV
jgi:phage-related minor tail protein